MPAMPGFGTDDDVMVTTVTRIQDVVSQLRQTASTMSGQLTAELNDATFAGAASTTFGKSEQDGVHGLVRADMQQLDAALDRLSMLVQQAATGYRTLDDQGQAAVQRSGAQAGASTSALNWG